MAKVPPRAPGRKDEPTDLAERARHAEREWRARNGSAATVPPAFVPPAAASPDRKRARDREREEHRPPRERVAEPTQVTYVTPEADFVARLQILHRLVSDAAASVNGGEPINSAVHEMVTVAADAAFGTANEGWQFEWLAGIISTLDQLAPLTAEERAPWLRLEPGQLLQRVVNWNPLVPVPGYLTRSIIQWAVRRYTPAERAGGGRLASAGMSMLLTHPEALQAALDESDGDRQAARNVRTWVDDHADEAPIGWYWGHPPDRIPARGVPAKLIAERLWANRPRKS